MRDRCDTSHDSTIQRFLFLFLVKVVRGFLARRRYKRLLEEAMIDSKKAAIFLKHSCACGNNLFLKQDELQQHDHRKKEGRIKIKQQEQHFPALKKNTRCLFHRLGSVTCNSLERRIIYHRRIIRLVKLFSCGGETGAFGESQKTPSARIVSFPRAWT